MKLDSADITAIRAAFQKMMMSANDGSIRSAALTNFINNEATKKVDFVAECWTLAVLAYLQSNGYDITERANNVRDTE